MYPGLRKELRDIISSESEKNRVKNLFNFMKTPPFVARII